MDTNKLALLGLCLEDVIRLWTHVEYSSVDGGCVMNKSLVTLFTRDTERVWLG